MNEPTNPQGKPDDKANEAFDQILKEMNSVRRLTKQEVLQSMEPRQLAKIVDRIGLQNWIVLSADGRSCLKDPATNRPFFHNNKKFAELVAKECGGVVVTWAEGLKILTDKNKPND